MTLLGWVLIASSFAMSAMFIRSLRSSGRSDEGSKLAVVARLSPSSPGPDQSLREASGLATVAVAVFLLIAGIGGVTTYLASGSDEELSSSPSSSDSDDDMLSRLTDYTRSIGAAKPAPAATAATAEKLLPDVNTMIERLAARLEAAPGDAQGWRMLGWSYAQMDRYGQAAAAYARALELDPSSAEVKRAYEEANAKASNGGVLVAASSAPASSASADESVTGTGAETVASAGAMSSGGQDAAIRSMVDGLAHRLETSPRDVEGWTRLMRSRVVLGETDVAASALRKALEVFKDDAAASGTIMAAASELGLKAD